MTNEDKKGETQIYELGFHLVPTVLAENVESEFKTIKGIIEKQGGVIFDEGIPQMMELAYTMEKRQERGYERYDSAYFGWVKFEIEGSLLEEIKEDLGAVPSLLRTLLIKADRENGMIGEVVALEDAQHADKMLEIADVTEVSDEGDITSSTNEEKEKVSEEALDKGIEGLVGEEKE